MIEILKNDNNTVACRMSDSIAPGDYNVIVPLLESKINEYGKINLYCEIVNVDNIDPAAIWEDLKFDAKHFTDFHCIAIVGDRRLTEWMTAIVKPFIGANIQYFESNQKDLAWNWIESKTEQAYAAKTK